MKYINLSQFHYGSIKTIKNKVYRIKYHVSQFHYGSIKTNQGGIMNRREL